MVRLVKASLMLLAQTAYLLSMHEKPASSRTSNTSNVAFPAPTRHRRWTQMALRIKGLLPPTRGRSANSREPPNDPRREGLPSFGWEERYTQTTHQPHPLRKTAFGAKSGPTILLLPVPLIGRATPFQAPNQKPQNLWSLILLPLTFSTSHAPSALPQCCCVFRMWLILDVSSVMPRTSMKPSTSAGWTDTWRPSYWVHIRSSHNVSAATNIKKIYGWSSCA